MTRQTRISYVLMLVLLLLVGFLHLTVPLLAVLLSYFALSKLSVGGRKWVGLILYFLLLGAVAWTLWFFVKHAVRALPELAQQSIPRTIEYAEKQGIELPFSDFASLKQLALDEVKTRWAGLGQYARAAAIEALALIVGVVVAVSLFLTTKLDFGEDPAADADNLYSAVGLELAARVRSFYRSFARVMGAQILISAINTVFTSVFLFWNDYPYAWVIVGLTFLCGVLPIIGNLISNTLIVCVGFTLSPTVAFAALVFLVVLHKGEYFLNSKIIGHRIRNPMWMTLLGLILGEKLMGIPGMILAPVVLHYVKVEASRNKV